MKFVKVIPALMTAILVGVCEAVPTVSNVTAKQRYPWNGLVDIEVTLSGTAEEVSESYCLFAATNVATQTALSFGYVTEMGAPTGAETTWTRHYVWNARADVGVVKIDAVDIAVAVRVGSGGVQLWENGPYFAECNVGATKPEEYGYYFWWGDTVGYKRNASNNSWVSVQTGSSFLFSDSNCPTYGKSNSQLQSEGYIDSTGNLVAAHDAATAHLGAPWRLPTDAEFAALENNCDTTWTTRNGVSGRLITGRGAYSSKSVFLPAASVGNYSGLSGVGLQGGCWSSTPYSDYSDSAWALDFFSNVIRRYNSYRYLAQSVRPVRGFAQGGEEGARVGSVTTQISIDMINVAYELVNNQDGTTLLVVNNFDWAKGGAIEPNGSTQWFTDGEYEGKTVYTNNDISDSQSTSIEFTIPDGLDSISFAWQVSSEQNFDYLRWYLDGNERGSISGIQDWTTITEPLSSGEHTLTFTYSKDGSVSDGSDCGWIAILTEGGARIEELFADCTITELTLKETVEKVPSSVFKAIPTIEKINVPSKEWWLNNAPTSNNPVAKGSATLCVNGEEVDMYYIEYDANGGEGEMPHTKMANNEVIVADCAYAKDGCSFIGWSRAKGGKVEAYPGNSFKLAELAGGDKITLYAVWGMDYNRVVGNAANNVEKTGDVLLVGYAGIGPNGENGLLWTIENKLLHDDQFGYDYYGLPEGEISFTVEGEGYFSFDYRAEYETDSEWGFGEVDFKITMDGSSWFVEGANNGKSIHTEFGNESAWKSKRYYIPAGTHTVTITIIDGFLMDGTRLNMCLSNFRKEAYAAPANIVEFARLLADQGVWAEGKLGEYAAQLEAKSMTAEERLQHAIIKVAEAFEDETLRAILPRFGYSASYMPMGVVANKEILGDEPIKLDDIPLSNDVVDAIFAAVEPKLKISLEDLAAIPDRNKVRLDHTKYDVLDEDIYVDKADRLFFKAMIEGALGALNYVKAQNYEVDYDSALNAATNEQTVVIEPMRPKTIRNMNITDRKVVRSTKFFLDSEDEYFDITIRKGENYEKSGEETNVYRDLQMAFRAGGEKYELSQYFDPYSDGVSFGDNVHFLVSGENSLPYWDEETGSYRFGEDFWGEIKETDKAFTIRLFLDNGGSISQAMKGGIEVQNLTFETGSSLDLDIGFIRTKHLAFEFKPGDLVVHKQFMTQTNVLDKVRFPANMVEAKTRVLTAFDDALRANAAVTNRTDTYTHAIEYDLADIEELDRIFTEIGRVKASLEGSAETINFADYVDEGKEVPEFAGRNSVTVCLAALFEGVMPLRSLIPESADSEVYAPYLDAIPDPTFGGLFPNETAESVRALALAAGLEDLKKSEADPCDSPITWAMTLAKDGVWIPGKLDEFEKFYAAKDTEEAKIMHAAITLAKLGENATLRNELAKFGFSLEDYTMNLIGELKDYSELPTANAALDVVYTEAIAALNVAIGDLNSIADDWTGEVAIKPEIYALDETTYVDNGDVTLLKSALYGLKAIVNLIAAYNYSDDKGDYGKIDALYSEHDPNAVKVWFDALPELAKSRVMTRFEASGENIKISLNKAKSANEILKNRQDNKLHFFEYDIVDKDDVELVESYIDKLIAALDGDTEIDLSPALERAGIEYEGTIPGGLVRIINLNPLFLGKIDRTLMPTISQEEASREVMVEMNTLDPTLNGLLPMTALCDWSQVLGGDTIVQHWTLKDFVKENPSLPMIGKCAKIVVEREVKCAGEVSWSVDLDGASEGTRVVFYDNGEEVTDNPYGFGSGSHVLKWIISAEEAQRSAIMPLKNIVLSLDGAVTIIPADGSVLTGDLGSVLGTLTTEVEEATIYYTLDGSEPTEASNVPLRGGKFQVNVVEGTHDGVYIKARAFLSGEALGKTSVSHVAYGRVENPVINGSLGNKFNHRGNVITISEATDNATIYYTLDGSEPTVESMRYLEPFTIDEATTVKAIAVRLGYFDSEVVEVSFEREYSAYDALDIADFEKVIVDNPNAWYIDWGNSADGVSSLRSPRVGEQEKTQFSLRLSGAGTLKFKWSIYGLTGWDCASCYVDGEKKKSIDCATDDYQHVWESESIVLGEGDHVVIWEYYEYCGDPDYDECVWLDCVEWIPEAPSQDADKIVVVGPNEEPVRIETKGDKLVGKVAPGTGHEEIKIHVKGADTKVFDTAKGYRITIAEDGTFSAELKEPEYKANVSTIFEEDGDGNVLLQIEVVPGLFYGAASSATLSELLSRPITLKQAQTMEDLPKAPKQTGKSGFYRVKVSNGPGR